MMEEGGRSISIFFSIIIWNLCVLKNIYTLFKYCILVMQIILVQCNKYLMFYYNTIAQMKWLEMKLIKPF